MAIITALEQLLEPDKKHPPHRVLPDGRGLWIIQIMYGFRLAVGRVDSLVFDDLW